MRSWYPIRVQELDNKRLLGEHVELHCMGKVLAKMRRGIKAGYQNHLETRRWLHHSKAMKRRHDAVAAEMTRRGMNHKSPWAKEYVNPEDSEAYPSQSWEPLSVMRAKLRDKQRRREDALHQERS